MGRGFPLLCRCASPASPLSCRRPRAQSTATPQSADYPGQRHARLQAPAPTAMLCFMQPQPVFDTHAFVKRLTKVGMPESQAEILAKGQSDLYERLVTKEYFESTLNHELEKLRAELKHELDQHKTANRQALKELELTLTHNMKEMEQKLVIKLGVLLGVSVTILAALIKFL